jgi:hypothetical protein
MVLLGKYVTTGQIQVTVDARTVHLFPGRQPGQLKLFPAHVPTLGPCELRLHFTVTSCWAKE